jgi:hypothetical protein
MTKDQSDLRPWGDLSATEQLELREAYQAELDRQPLTCSLDEKMNRFTKWLEERGVAFSMDDLRRKKS